MNSTNFLDLIPGFTNGVHALHAELVGVTFVLAVAGLLFHVLHAQVSGTIRPLGPTLVRLAMVALLVGALESWGDMLVTAVEGLISDMGANGNGADIFQDYQAAIARKLGSAAAAANFSQSNSPSSLPQTEGDTSGGFTPQSTGVTLTHYAYPGDSNGDGNSRQGIGAFPFSSAPGSLIPLYSAALSPDVAAHYNVQPGQSFSIGTVGGQTYNLVYADKTDASLTGRVDIYDPNNALGGGNNFSALVARLNGGPLVFGQTGLAAFMPNPGGSIGDQILWAITLGLSWVALGLMWIMKIVQKLLYLVEIAISPIFIGMLMVPALIHLARRFFMILVAICLWPLGWAVCNLVTKLLIDLTVNSSPAASAMTAPGMFTGPLLVLAYLLVVAVWVIGSTLAAPLFIGILFGIGGGSATAAVFGATLGTAAAQAGRMASGAVGGPVGMASAIAGIGSHGSNGSAPVSVQSATRMSAPVINYATRPMAAPQTSRLP